MRGPEQPSGSLLHHLAALGSLVLLCIYATWPLAADAAISVPINLLDPLENAWIFAWDSHALANDPLDIFHANIFHPQENTLAFAENMIGIALFVAPIFWISENALLTTNAAVLLVL